MSTTNTPEYPWAHVSTYELPSGAAEFVGTDGAAVIAAVKAHKDIVANVTDNDSSLPVFIPYTAVRFVKYRNKLASEPVEDDNCKVRTPEAGAVLRLVSNESSPLDVVTLSLSDTSINGTYSGVTFTDGVATIPENTIMPGGGLSIVGLPRGTSVSARVGGAPDGPSGIIPCTLQLHNPAN